MALLLLLVAATCFLAYSNGANDNFKGVATLFGSNTTDYKAFFLPLSWVLTLPLAALLAAAVYARLSLV